MALEELYYDFVGASQENYTDESWETLTVALAVAESLLNEGRESATQEEVDAAFDNLLSAVENLLEKEEPGEDPKDPPTLTDPEPRNLTIEFGKVYEVYANDRLTIQSDHTNPTITMPAELPQGTKVSVEDARDRSEVTENERLLIAGDALDVVYL